MNAKEGKVNRKKQLGTDEKKREREKLEKKKKSEGGVALQR